MFIFPPAIMSLNAPRNYHVEAAKSHTFSHTTCCSTPTKDTTPVNINRANLEQMGSFKVHGNQHHSVRSSHTSTLVKKARIKYSQNTVLLYFVRELKRAKLPCQILVNVFLLKDNTKSSRSMFTLLLSGKWYRSISFHNTRIQTSSLPLTVNSSIFYEFILSMTYYLYDQWYSFCFVNSIKRLALCYTTLCCARIHK